METSKFDGDVPRSQLRTLRRSPRMLAHLSLILNAELFGRRFESEKVEKQAKTRFVAVYGS